MMRKKFYKRGLRFECTGCGQCCTHPGGYVAVTAEEAGEISKFLEIDEGEFLEDYLLPGPDEQSFQLRSRSNGECILLQENRCSIYALRPLQCRTFPFWPENLKSAYRWKLTAQECPGIGQGRLFEEVEISRLLSLMKK